MSHSNFIDKKNFGIVFSIIALLFFLVDLFLICVFKDKNLEIVTTAPSKYEIKLYTDENCTTEVELPFYGNENNNESKIYVFYCKLPKVYNYNVIHIQSRFNFLSAYLGDEEVFEAEISTFRKLKNYTSLDQCFIPLKESYSGNILKIYVRFQNNFYKAGLSGINITTLLTYIKENLNYCLPSCIMATLLFIASLVTFVTLIISYVFKHDRKKDDIKRFIATFSVSLCIVIWIFTSFDVCGVILGNSSAVSFLNYISFTILPVTFCSFLLSVYKKNQIFIRILRICCVLNFIGQNIMFLFFDIDFTQMLFLTHIFSFATVVTNVIVVIDISYQKEFSRQQKMFCIGTGLFAFSGILGIIIYIINLNTSFMFFMSIGLFLFFGMHMFSSLIMFSDSMKEHRKLIDSEKESYQDSLTNLGNRKLYYKQIEVLTKSGLDENINFIMMDVNGLKFINDTLGHDAGDDLLRGTAVCMRKFFPDAEILCRMGGDEFFLIIRESQDTLNKRISSFLNYAKNFEYNSIKTISISYGIANLEKYPNCTISELEKAADKEMYHYKAEYYKNSAMDRRRR